MTPEEQFTEAVSDAIHKAVHANLPESFIIGSLECAKLSIHCAFCNARDRAELNPENN